MDLLDMVIIIIHISHAHTRKYASSSDESIENLLYYKDCKHKLKEPSTELPITKLRETPPQPVQQECACPRMCCSMCCATDCFNQPFMSRQLPLQQNVQQPIQPMQPIQPPVQPRQPQKPVQQKVNPRSKRKKKPQPMLPPIGGRRDLGYTREHIKSLISQDDDIKKILKDLVRVTMQKVDLLEMINNRRKEMKADAEGSNDTEEDSEYEMLS